MLIIIIFVGCQEEDQEVKQQFTKDQVRTLLASTGSKLWELKSGVSFDFEPCIDGEIYVFATTESDTGIVYVTEPFIECTEGVDFERDTLSSFRWTLTESESEIFDNQLFFIFDENNTVNYTVNLLNPVRLELENSDNTNEMIFFEELIEEGKPPTKDEIRTILSAEGDKFWEVTANSSDDFQSCIDGNIYIFSLDESDTGFVYITEPLFDCEGTVISERDTVETFKWALTDSESILFDDQLYFINDTEVTIFNVNGIDDMLLQLQEADNNDAPVLTLESL
ncbi:MAG: hypothetical protein AAFQ94_08420 [Bacteroidota bacterium]